MLTDVFVSPNILVFPLYLLRNLVETDQYTDDALFVCASKILFSLVGAILEVVFQKCSYKFILDLGKCTYLFVIGARGH